MLAAVVHEYHAGVVERDAALRAAIELRVRRQRLAERTGVPVRALHRPRHDVLEPAEHRAPLPGLLGDAIALVETNRRTAPAAPLADHGRTLAGRRRCKI